MDFEWGEKSVMMLLDDENRVYTAITLPIQASSSTSANKNRVFDVLFDNKVDDDNAQFVEYLETLNIGSEVCVSSAVFS
jgi:hypothetical protein